MKSLRGTGIRMQDVGKLEGLGNIMPKSISARIICKNATDEQLKMILDDSKEKRPKLYKKLIERCNKTGRNIPENHKI